MRAVGLMILVFDLYTFKNKVFDLSFYLSFDLFEISALEQLEKSNLLFFYLLYQNMCKKGFLRKITWIMAQGSAKTLKIITLSSVFSQCVNI